MKFKKSILITLFALMIVCLGVVSASDVSTNETIAESDNTELISETQIEDTISEKDNVEVISERDEFSYSERFNNTRLEINNQVNNNNLYEDAWEGYDDEIARVSSSVDLNGTIALSIDGIQYYNRNIDIKDCYDDIRIHTEGFNLPDNLKTGYHNVVLTYLENGIFSYSINNTVEFRYAPTIKHNYSDGILTLTIDCLLPESSGIVTIYDIEDRGDHSRNWKGVFIGNCTIENGKGKIVLNNFKPKDDYQWEFECTVDGQKYSVRHYFGLDSNKNSNQNPSSTSTNTNSNQNSKVTKLNTKITAKKNNFQS